MGDREVDQQLVERAQRGDKHAFELLIAKYQRRLARLISRFVRDTAEVEDVTQEAFIKAYRALPAFRGESDPMAAEAPSSRSTTSTGVSASCASRHSRPGSTSPAS